MPTLTLPLAPLLLAFSVEGTLSVLGAILGIGFLIFVHELGHFLACRATGTRVETFSIGFGPRLFGWERVGTVRRFTVGARTTLPSEGVDVRVAAIPLGGYVKMAGELGGDGSPGKADVERRPPKPDELPAKPFPARAFIICAGVIMNFVVAIALFSTAYGAGLEQTEPVIGVVTRDDPAWEAGLRPGDRVRSYGGEAIRSFEDLRGEIIYSHKGEPVRVEIERDGAPRTLSIVPRYDEQGGHPQVGVQEAVAWTVDDHVSPPFTIGAVEPVRVDGRTVVGGRMAATLAETAKELGRRSVRIERVGAGAEPPHEVRLPSPKAGTGRRDWKIGISSGGPVVVARVAPGSPAAAAGLREGDRFVSIDGHPLVRRAELELLPSLASIGVARGESSVDVAVGAKDADAVAAFLDGITFRSDRESPYVVPSGSQWSDGKSPAAEAGIRAGDRIVSIGGKKVESWTDVIAAVDAFSADPVEVVVQDPSGAIRSTKVTPRHPEESDHEDFLKTGPVPHVTVAASGPFGAIGMGVSRTGREVRNVFRMIARFVSGDISPGKNLGGPGTIVMVSSQTASQGWGQFLAFLAFISVNLAVLNILPIPVLDGGALLLLIVEKARRGRPLQEATVAWIQWAGFALLMLLMVFAIKNDITNLTR